MALNDISDPGSPKSFIFQANPQFYDIYRAVRDLSEMNWTMVQLGNAIKPGDRVYIWESGPFGGVIAEATALARPRIEPFQEGEEFILDPAKFAGEQLRVKLSIDHVLDEPLRREFLKGHPTLKGMRILQFANNTNYLLSEEQATGLQQVVDGPLPEELGASIAWDLRPGQSILRSALHKRFGGHGQGFVSPSIRTPNVFLFYDPEAGDKDEFPSWQADGCLHYLGDGNHGDQEMKAGNAAILKHLADGRALHVFRGVRGTVTYDGEFELDDSEPYQRADAPEADGGPLREVFVFRLRPMDVKPPEATSKLTDVLTGPKRVDVPIEQQETEKAYVNPSRAPYEAERREQKLVLALEAHLLALGHKVNRQRLLPSGEARPIVTDLFDATTGTLVEAKGSVVRNAIRMAIGQLCDYRRLFDDGEVKHVAALFPKEPRADLCDLLREQGIVVIHPTGKGFDDSTGGGLVNEE